MRKKGRRRGRNEGTGDLPNVFGCPGDPRHEFIHMGGFWPVRDG